MKEPILEIMLFTRIHPLSRPRMGRNKGSIYQPKENQQELLVEMSNYKQENPISIPVSLEIEICFLRPPKVDIPYPTSNNYGDIDNLSKAIFDAMVTMNILADDNLVIDCMVSKRFNEEDFCKIKIYSADAI